MIRSASPPRRRRPLRALLLAALALLVVGAVLAPGLLGWFVHQRSSALLAESWPDATVRWQRGWFASRLEAADGQAHLVLDLRHPPLDLSAPLTADGTLTLAEPAARIALDTALGWSFHLEVAARADDLRSSAAISIRAERPRLALWRGRDGALDLRIEADGVALAGPPDARLDTRDVVLTSAFDGDDPGRFELDLSAARSGRPASRLRVVAERIDAERAGALGDALGAALAAPPDSATASIAWLGVASAWEQLARAGLVLELAPLALDGEARVEGRWAPADGPSNWQGGGDLAAVEAWLVPILGLARAEPSDQLRDEVDLWLEQAAAAGRLRIDGDRFELTGEPDG